MRRVLTKEQKEKMDCTDFDHALGIGLYHHTHSERVQEEPEILHRGLVVNKEEEILYEFLPMHQEIVIQDVSLLEGIPEDVGSFDIFKAVEGCLLRVFHYGGKWLVTTNRRLDAFQSRWSSKYSFGDLMVYTLQHLFPDKKEDVLHYFLNSLDPTLRYVFMTRFNNDNRIVCRVQDVEVKNRLLFIGYYKNAEADQAAETAEAVDAVDAVSTDDNDSDQRMILAYDKMLDHEVLGKLGRQPPLVEDPMPSTAEDLARYVLEKVDVQKSPGLILFHKTRNIQIKLVNPSYAYLAGLRGNQSNIALRYLELRAARDHNPEHEDIQAFMKLYDRSTRMFQNIEEGLAEAARKISFYYTERFVHNRFISVPFPEYSIMKKCHQWYLQDVSNRRVYLRVVLDFLKRESPLFLYRLVHRLRHNV